MAAIDVLIQSFLKMLPPDTAKQVGEAVQVAFTFDARLRALENNTRLMMQHMGIETQEQQNGPEHDAIRQ